MHALVWMTVAEFAKLLTQTWRVAKNAIGWCAMVVVPSTVKGTLVHLFA